MPGEVSGLYRFAQWLAEKLTLPRAAALAEYLADLQWRRARRDRAAIRANLRHILGSSQVDGHEVREVFRNFGRYLIEFLLAHRYPEGWGPTQGLTEIEEALRRHPGCIILSAHLGNWEVGAVIVRQLGFPISVVALPHRDARVNRFFDRQRARCGVGVIPLGPRATHHCAAHLRAGHPIAILGDREFGSSGIAVSFCGQQVQLPRGPAVLSLRTGVPVVPLFVVRQAPWQYRFYTEPPIWPPERSASGEHVKQLTQTYAQVMERFIRQFPSQWLMFQPFTQGVGSVAAACPPPGEAAASTMARE